MGVREERLAVRRDVGVFDVSHMGEIETRGPQALELLQRLSAPAVPRPAPRLTKRVHAHGLRPPPSWSEGVAVNVVQQQFGHGSLSTTARTCATWLRVHGHVAWRRRASEL